MPTTDAAMALADVPLPPPPPGNRLSVDSDMHTTMRTTHIIGAIRSRPSQCCHKLQTAQQQ